LKALLEIKKGHAEIMIVALDHKAHMMAVEATLRAMGTRIIEIFYEHLASEQNKIRAERAEWQTAVQTLEKAIGIVDPQIRPSGQVN